MQSNDESKANLLERLEGRVARREESRIARRLWKKPGVDAIYRWEEGALLDAFVPF